MRERERMREGGIERESGGGRESEGGRERCPELLFLFFKGMTGALAPFSYLVLQYSIITTVIKAHSHWQTILAKMSVMAMATDQAMYLPWPPWAARP